LSFKGPGLALPEAGIPFRSYHRDAIPALGEARLARSVRPRSGAVWSRASVPFSAWELKDWGPTGHVVHLGQGHVGSVLGGLFSWDDITIFDSSARAIQVSSGLLPTCPDRAGWVLGSCHPDFGNWPHPFRVRITYWSRGCVSLNSGLAPSHPDEVCFFGVSAATSMLAGDHDVLSFLTFSLSELSPVVILSLPSLEVEQLRLHRQLEWLQARLALGTREDITPQPISAAPGYGERLSDLEETLGKPSWVLQALQGLSKQLAQADRQWKKQMGAPGQARAEGSWALHPSCQVPSAPEKRGHLSRSLSEDSTKVRALPHGQRTLLQTLQEIREGTGEAAARMASEAWVYLPVGAEHHFLELDQILSLLHRLWSPAVSASAIHTPGWPPEAFSCLWPGIFLFFLLIQTVGFFCYLHFSRQEPDKSLREHLSTGSLPQGPTAHVPRALGALRRQ
uniref:Lectin, mannose binding 1 like n=1 Tax=Microcebus murinus TaxID=30608 RepID=A0A8C5UYA1_MICMU